MMRVYADLYKRLMHHDKNIVNLQRYIFKMIPIGYFKHRNLTTYESNMNRRMEKPTICIGENKGADQLRGNLEADQRLCFRYTDSTLPLLSKSKISL